MRESNEAAFRSVTRASGPRLGDLAAWPSPLRTGATGEDVDRVFRASSQVRSVVLCDGLGAFLLNRTEFYQQFSGELGFGRALLARRPIDRTTVAPSRELAADTLAWQAALELVDGTVNTLDDLAVRRDDGTVGSLPVATLLQHLRRTAEELAVEQSRLVDRLQRQALHDGLTGLPNRAAFARDGARVVADATRSGGSAAVVFCDLDGFKAVNDRSGHAVGDAVLVAVAARFQRVLPPTAVMARLGGDEFVVALPGDASIARGLAAALRRALAEPVVVLGTTVVLGVSIGIATTAEATSFDALVQRADDAMYAAKRNGRGVTTWRRTAHDLTTLDRVATELLPALDSGQVSVHFQPIVALPDRRPVEYETLLRWQHPELGFVPPSDFIPVAEAHGMMVPVGRWVVQRALEACAEWRSAGIAASVCINVSMTQLVDPMLSRVLADGVATSGLEPSQVVLELTETALMTDVAASIEVLRQLRRTGFRVAIDDFGVGYSSLAYLSELPIDIVKVDGRFTSRLTRSDRDRALSAGIVDLAHSIGLTVVAEMVEYEAQHEILVDLGIDRAQGYLYGRPGPTPVAAVVESLVGAHAESA